MPFLLSLLLTAVPDCITATDGGTVITCGGAKVLVSIAPGSPTEALPIVVEGMARLYTAVEKKNVEVQLGKQRLPAVDLTLLTSSTDKKPIGTARLTAAKERENLSRVLICIREPSVPVEHCQRGFELALTIVDPTAPDSEIFEGKGPWAGAALTVPAGCRLTHPGSLQCKSVSLMWGDRPPDGPLNSQKMLAELALRQMPKGSTRTDRACRIGGKPSNCVLLTGAAKGETFTIIIGVGEVQNRSTSFQCIVMGELRDVVPSPCDQLVAFEKK